MDFLLQKPGANEQSYSELAKEGIIMVTESRHLKIQKKAIQDIATWTEAFLTFATEVQAPQDPKEGNPRYSNLDRNLSDICDSQESEPPIPYQ